MDESGRDPGTMSQQTESPKLLPWQASCGVAELGLDAACVWVVELDAGIDPAEVETAEPGPEQALLAADEPARAARFIRARDRRRFVRCRVALRQILGGILALPPGSLRFRATGKGKPEIDPTAVCGDCTREGLPLCFNVTHSARLGLIAVSWGRDLGVDLEQVRPFHEAARIVESFFSAVELATFNAIPDEAKEMSFVRGWTRKEAILKGLGIGLEGLSAHYETGFGTTALLRFFTPALPEPQVKEWQLWEAAPRESFVAALAIKPPL